LTYQVSGLIAPKWSLSLSRRGVVQLNRQEVSAIFGDDNFELLRKNKMIKYNAPFTETIEGQLFQAI